MYSVVERYRVIVARAAGVDPRTVARLTGISPRTQRRILQEEVSYGMSEQQCRAGRRVGRPTTLAPVCREALDRYLAAQPQLPVAELLRRLRTEHDYLGGKNPVYAYVRAHRPAPPASVPVVRFEGLAGEFAQYDGGSLTVTYQDGTAEKLTFFAGRLKYSRALHFLLVPGETAEVYIRGLEACARVWGGLPLFNVVDNCKACVLRREPDPVTGERRVVYNAHFRAFLDAAGVLGEATHPYSGNQKGSVENLVGFVKGGFFQARTFRNRFDLEHQREGWLHYVNHVRPCDATGVIPAVRLRAEQDRLRPLVLGPHGYGLLYPAVVGRDARVRWGGYQYSTPATWIGQAVTVRVHPEVVILHHADPPVVHPRVPANGRYSLLAEHQPALFTKPRGRTMAQRQILVDLCPEGERFFTELVHRRPRTWRTQDLPAIWRLFEAEGAAALRGALRQCVQQGTWGAEYLRAQLEGWTATGHPEEAAA